MFFLMAISLYTSRIILYTLGVKDFGIYNIVASIIVLFSFINNALTSTTRRFINYLIGQGDRQQLRKTFTSLLTIHLGVAFLILILGETIGLWILNSQLNIPTERIFAANIVYQVSIVTAMSSIALAPYEGAIVAEERMSIYAYISLLEAVFKLGLVATLLFTPFDRLITYSIYLFLISIFFLVFKYFYCTRNFSYCDYRLNCDRGRIRPLISFSGWSLFGQIAYIGSTTGVNMIINTFLGVTVNAAIGIAQQINSTLYNFVSNFQTAFNPQLVQTYASGSKDEHRLLISRATRMSYFLLFIIAVPVMFNIDFLLHLWLVEVPPYTASFATLIIAFSLIEATGAPLWMSMQAIGNIRNYQIIVSSINILNIPLAFLLLSMKFSPISIFIGQLNIGIVLYIFRFYYVLPKLGISKKDYTKDNILPILTISGIIVTLISCLVRLFINDWFRLIVITILSIIANAILIYRLGLSEHERKAVRLFIHNYRHS